MLVHDRVACKALSWTDLFYSRASQDSTVASIPGESAQEVMIGAAQPTPTPPWGCSDLQGCTDSYGDGCEWYEIYHS